jgi:integrase
MPRHVGMLSSRRVATAKPQKGRTSLVLSDGANLYLQCTLADDGKTVRKSWTFRYGLDGKRHEMGLGSANTFSLPEARQRARTLRQQLVDGIDPLRAKEAARQARLAEAAKQVTFRRCAEMYLNLHQGGWSASHRRQWHSTLRDHVFPVLGDLTVADIDQAAVMKVVEPIWKTKTVTATRVRSRIEAVLDYALAYKFRQGDNPARVLSALPKASRVAKVEHMAALPWRAMPPFMTELRALEGMPARALEFTILCAARTGEVLGAQWSEIDLKTKTWTVPASRMKAGAEHRVPLSARALEILAALPKGDGHIFGRLPDKALRRHALNRLRPDGAAHVHGFRASFKTWASESTSFAPDIVEAALAHKRGNATTQAYERGDLFEKRRRLMNAWSDYCAKGARAAGDVVTLRGAAHA